MTVRTQAYFGDGVYAAFDGELMMLKAGDNIIYLERGAAERIAQWAKDGHTDHNSGLTFAETVKLPKPRRPT